MLARIAAERHGLTRKKTASPDNSCYIPFKLNGVIEYVRSLRRGPYGETL